MKKELFGTTKEGAEVYAYTLENKNGMKARVMNFGAILLNLYVPDAQGHVDDLVLGFDKLEDYYGNGSFFGATIGPNANRIGNAQFTLHGKTYQLEVNDGPNNLHSHMEKGYHKCLWTAEPAGENGVRFSLEEPDGNLGFPGRRKVSVTYSLSEKNELSIHYEATSDADTILNMTNHTYFNLSGHKAGKIEDHILTIHGSQYVPVLPGAIPTGEIATVEGTPMDFRQPKQVGKEIGTDWEQLKLVQGYDHNWVLDGADGSLREAAVLTDPKSGRTMKTFTTLPGLQFYAGNCISPEKGKDGASYGPRSGMCLETQYFPDTANQPNFPSAVFGPERVYDATTVYQFV